MNINSLPLCSIIDVEKDQTGKIKAKLNPIWQKHFEQNVGQLQQNLSDSGYFIPKQTTTNIDLQDGSENSGLLVYDNDTHELKVNINGTIKVIQVA